MTLLLLIIYPRWRGGTYRTVWNDKLQVGLSPLARGNRSRVRR